MWDSMKDEEELNQPQNGMSGFRRMLAGKDSEDIARGSNNLKR